ncbi:MAG: hypothetical protein K1X88_36375 [Nannocystaceae bacterium]|nr:hypothetical protein [Nannocystaceae bacterium]
MLPLPSDPVLAAVVPEELVSPLLASVEDDVLVDVLVDDEVLVDVLVDDALVPSPPPSSAHAVTVDATRDHGMTRRPECQCIGGA